MMLYIVLLHVKLRFSGGGVGAFVAGKEAQLLGCGRLGDMFEPEVAVMKSKLASRRRRGMVLFGDQSCCKWNEDIFRNDKITLRKRCFAETATTGD
jgi:hypothetical protein